jgi:hypothetical protein
MGIQYSIDYANTWIDIGYNIDNNATWRSISMSSSGQYITAVQEDGVYTCTIPYPKVQATSFVVPGATGYLMADGTIGEGSISNIINASTINVSTINFSTMIGSSIITSSINGGPYGFSTINGSIITSTLYTNSTLLTIPSSISSVIFTLVGAGGSAYSSAGIGGGGGGAGVTLTVNNPSDSIFALYPGNPKNTYQLGGEMSVLFSTSGTTYTCMAIAAGGGGSGSYPGGSGGGGGGGARGEAGYGGIGGNGNSGGSNGQDFSIINNPPVFLNIDFPTISVGGSGGDGHDGGGSGGDGYGGGGGGGYSASINSNFGLGGGGGGNYAYSDNINYFSSINNGFSAGTGGGGGNPGIEIGTYGFGGSSPGYGNPGVIQVTFIPYPSYTTSLHDLVPSTNQTIGTLTNPWSTMYTSSITVGTTTVSSVKSFIIEHPQKTNKYLVHTCLEGPEVGVYYRGKSQIESTQNTVNLPKYVSDLAHDFTINITPIYNGKIRSLNCSEIINNSFTVYGEPGTFHWSVYGKRGDIEVEPDKDSVVVKGDGPYKYLTL